MFTKSKEIHSSTDSLLDSPYFPHAAFSLTGVIGIITGIVIHKVFFSAKGKDSKIQENVNSQSIQTTDSGESSKVEAVLKKIIAQFFSHLSKTQYKQFDEALKQEISKLFADQYQNMEATLKDTDETTVSKESYTNLGLEFEKVKQELETKKTTTVSQTTFDALKKEFEEFKSSTKKHYDEQTLELDKVKKELDTTKISKESLKALLQNSTTKYNDLEKKLTNITATPKKPNGINKTENGEKTNIIDKIDKIETNTDK